MPISEEKKKKETLFGNSLREGKKKLWKQLLETAQRLGMLEIIQLRWIKRKSAGDMVKDA